MYAYSLRSNAHVSFPCYFNSWILIWVRFGTQINIHVVGALTHKISSVEVRDRSAKCRRGFYRVSTFDLNVPIRNVACLITINHCPVIIAKQVYSDVTLNMHSQFSVLFCFSFWLFLFSFCFCLFCLGHFDFVCLTSFENRRTWGFSILVNKCDFNGESRTNLDYRHSTRIKTIIIRNKKEKERKEKKNQLKSKKFQRYELVKGWKRIGNKDLLLSLPFCI